MPSNKIFCLLSVFLLSVTVHSIGRAQKPMGEVMCACPGASKPLGNAPNCEEACYGRRSPSGASSDMRAREEARVREEAEARAREEAEAAERERIAEAKRQKNKEESDAKFIRDRNAAARTLKGSSETNNANDFGLKGSGGSGLKGAVAEPMLKGSTTSAADTEIMRLNARDRELTAALDKDVAAIRNLGFARRAEDFAEWEKLSADAKAQFEKEVVDAATDQIVGKVSDHLLEGFSRFNAAKARRWVSVLEKVKPRPNELIRLIRKVGRTANKAKVAKDAAKIVLAIERLQQAFTAQTREDLLLLGMDLMCDVVRPPGNASCHAFKTVSKLTVAAVYNNVARRVAINEVERLTTMTEQQLRALAKLNESMVKHVKERNEVRTKLKDLE